MEKHPAEKAQADLVKAEEAFQHFQALVASCAVEAPADITKTPAYLKLKDAQRAAEFFQVGCAGMDDAAQLNTTLTEGLRTLQIDGLALADWIDWAGGDCPLPAGAVVDVKTRDGRMYERQQCGATKGYAADTCWERVGTGSDVVAYRVSDQQRPAPCGLIAQALLTHHLSAVA